ncbi:2536_t:CDS:1, partial [Diversispora eburnea]
NSSRLQNRRKRKTSVLLKISKGKKSKSKKSKIVTILRTSFVWNFFITDHDTETYVVYAICQIIDCTRKYAYHGSTTNLSDGTDVAGIDYTKYLRDDHHITEALLSSKTPEEISNLKQSKKQQSIDELLLRPLSSRRQKLLNQDLVKFIVGTR